MSDRVVTAARGWIGTPYRHQASCRGAGADCLGLVRGIWRELVGPEPERSGPYDADWAESLGRERLLEAARRHFRPAAPMPGAVLVFRMRAEGVAKHMGIMAAGVAGPTLIHAYSGRGVVETPLGPGWMRRCAGAFAFPLEE